MRFATLSVADLGFCWPTRYCVDGVMISATFPQFYTRIPVISVKIWRYANIRLCMPGNSEMMNCGIRPTKFISLADKLSAYEADLFGELANIKGCPFIVVTA